MNEEVSRDMTGEADGMNQGVMHNLNERSVIFNEEMVGGRERVTTDEERVGPTASGVEQRSDC